MDDGADLVSTLHKGDYDFKDGVIGGSEETTTGVIRLRAMEKDGVLPYPVISVNDALTKHFFDNRYGTGQSHPGRHSPGDQPAAGRQNASSSPATAGADAASRCGRKGMGAIVIVTEIDPLKAIEAAMDGFCVMPMERGRRSRRFVHHVNGQHLVLALSTSAR